MRFAPILVSSLLLVGCSAPEVRPEPEPTEQPTIVESISVPQALERTRALSSAGLGILILTRLGEEEAAVEGQGFIDMQSGAAEVRWADELGDVLERKTSDGLFIQLDPPDGTWFQFNEFNATPTSYALSPFTDLERVTDFVDEGPEQIEGMPSTRFVGTIDAQDCIRGAGFSTEDEENFADAVVCGVTVWVDDTGIILRIDRSFRAGTTNGEEARSMRSTNLFDFGSPVRITTPAAFEQAPGG